VQKRFVVNVAAVPRNDQNIGGEAGTRRNVRQVSCIDVAGHQCGHARQHKSDNTPRIEIRDDTPTQRADGVDLSDSSGCEGDARSARPSPGAYLRICGEVGASIEGTDRSTMQRSRHAADRGRCPAGQHDPRQCLNAQRFKASIDGRRRRSGVDKNA
jgi:hypothetical protein